MDNKESKLTAEEFLENFTFKIGGKATNEEVVLKLMEAYAEEVSKQRVLEALEKEVPKAVSSQLYKETNIRFDMCILQGEQYYKNEVEPLYNK